MSTQPHYDNVEVKKVHENTSQDVLIITIDKLRLIMTQHQDSIERKKEWHTPLGIALTLAVVFPTTDFKEFLKLDAAVWKALFILSLILILLWLVRSAWTSFHSISIEQLVDKIKAGDS